MRFVIDRMFVWSVATAMLPAALAAQSTPVRGFPPDALPGLAKLETIIRNPPDTARLRQYHLVMTEEPHHAGSAGSKAVAEYALARFREWGLEARIEEFQALMPFPAERRVEPVGPERYPARRGEPALPDDKDSGRAGSLSCAV